MKKIYTIVGGGIAGLVSAIYLSRKGHSVQLIEASNQWGGLLGLAHQWQNFYFDFGTHFISATGDSEVDDFLFGKNLINTASWQLIPQLKSGSYTFGHLSNQAPSLNLRPWQNQNPEQFLQACCDFIHLKKDSVSNNLFEHFTQSYGKTIAESVLKPVMMKLLDYDPSLLTIESHIPFGLRRLIFGSDVFLKEIKKSPFFDDVLSYADREKSCSLPCFYPAGGVNDWIQAMVTELTNNPLCQLLPNTQVSNFKKDSEKWQVTLKNSQQSKLDIHCNELIWSAPLILLKRILPIEIQQPAPKKSFRIIDLYHFVFDELCETGLDYFYCYDPNLISLRVTIYPPQLNQKGRSLTVEVLRNPETEGTAIEIIHNELIKMQIVPGNSQCLYKHYQPLKTGFPVLSLESKKFVNEFHEKVKENYPEIKVLGRESGKHFFMKDVLVDLYHTLTEMEP
ncbi:MAG: FAD-dependent oxidoreductase [Pseudomonadota bacterium]